MAQRSPADVYAALVGAGFTPAQATIETAIAGAESGYNDTSLGDVNLEDSTWGPSYGLFQIRTLKADTGRGTDRDINWLSQSDANQAKAAFDISNHGANFSPWTTYTSGAYQKFMGQAGSAAGTTTVTPTGNGSNPFPTFGPSWLPWNWPSDAGNAASNTVNQALGGARTIAVEAAFVVLGLGLLYVGAIRLIKPKITAKENELRGVIGAVV